MNLEERTPTLRVRPRDVSELALVVGDPQRAASAAGMMENAEELGTFREYRTFTGTFAGKRITVSSHGIGSSGANMCFHELFNCGVKTVIRAGTCGAMVPGIKDGELIIATGAIREDGCSEHMAPMSYPAIADRHIIAALETASVNAGRPHPYVGLVISQAYFYPGILPNELDFWIPTGLIQAVEMELATLLVMAGLRGLRAGGIFTSDGNLTATPNPDDYDPHRKVVEEGKTNMLKIAFNALVALS